MEKALSWDQIKSEDSKSPQNYAMYLRSYGDGGNGRVEHCVLKLVLKLKFKLREK